MNDLIELLAHTTWDEDRVNDLWARWRTPGCEIAPAVGESLMFITTCVLLVIGAVFG